MMLQEFQDGGSFSSVITRIYVDHMMLTLFNGISCFHANMQAVTAMFQNATFSFFPILSPRFVFV